MKPAAHRNPRERDRIDLQFDEAISCAIKTPPVSDAQLLRLVKSDRTRGVRRRPTKRKR